MHFTLTHDDIVSLLCHDRYYHSGTHIDLDAVAPAVLRWIREAQEAAFEDGFTSCANEHTKQLKDPSHPITRVNPYEDKSEPVADLKPLPRIPDPGPSVVHVGHLKGEWFYACEACSGMPEGSL